MSKENHMGMDLGSHQKIFFDRSMMAPTQPQTLPDGQPNPHYSVTPQHDGIVTGYYKSGLEQTALKPKLNELPLWTIELNGNFHFRLDTIIAAARAEAPARQPVNEPEFIPADDADLNQ